MSEKMTRGQFLLCLAGTALAQEKTKQITSEELEALLKQHVFLLDVREPRELVEVGAVKGYMNIPLGQLESRLSEVPKDKTIVTICARGVRAGKAGDILVKHGYKVAGACGITEWKAKNKPVVYPK
ncbi:MAG: rhodanese-like domain-containing protein [Bryobacterales bacterium]|nr:rhodanese-like domain-containing protein [Bryobacterales bacterium]